jgi:chemotaxis signal transduction protein
MASNQTATVPANSSLRDIPDSYKHCIFGCGDSWFSVPAVSVREIVIAPELVRVPNCHQALVGLGHLRSEFVPVISLSRLLNIDFADHLDASDCLLVLEGSCVWSFLISESVALESLETIVSQDARAENVNSAAIGTAMFRDRIVRVLNPNELLVTAQHAFDHYWDRSDIEVNSRREAS